MPSRSTTASAPRGRARRRLWRKALRFTGEEDRTAEIPLGARGRTLTLVGLGKSAGFTEEKARAFVERAIESARSAKAASLGLVVPEHAVFFGEAAAERIARRLALAEYLFDPYLPRQSGARLKSATVAVPTAWRRAYAAGAGLGAAIAAGVALTRDLGNTPPNLASPEWIVRQVRGHARRWGATIRVLAEPELKRRKMGGILAVGAGSKNPPRLVRIDLGSAKRGGPVIALVGKGITFDTGGISIKPAAQMDEMKWDKMGACAVLGILEAASRLASARSACAPTWRSPRTCRMAPPSGRATSCVAPTARRWRSSTPTPKVAWFWRTLSPGRPATSRKRWSSTRP